MRRFIRTSTRTALSPKQLAAHATLITMAVLSGTFLLMERTRPAAIAQLRATVADAFTPVLQVLSKPVVAIENAGQSVADMVNLRADNIRLKQQNAELLKWQSAALELQAQNEAFKALNHIVVEPDARFVTARVVSENADNFTHTALINAGASDGVAKNQAVISDEGLVGRVIETGQTSARVLLISDINSRIPVRGEHSRERAMLAGGNAATQTLDHVAPDSQIAVGERLITSGDGGIFPAGIPVAMVVSIENDIVHTQPLASFHALEWVRVVDYKL